MNQPRRLAALLFLLPAAPLAQTTGISHPEAVPDQPFTTQESAPPPTPNQITYQPQPAPALQPRPHSSGQADYPPVPYSPTAVTVIATPVGSSATSSGSAFDPDANIVTRVEGPANQLPAGTFLKTLLGQDVSTDTTAEGTSFTASLTEPILREGRVLLPVGSLITGRVTEVRSGKRISGSAAIHLQPQSITLPDGTRYKLLAQVIDTSLIHSTKVDDEGTIRSHGSSAVQKGAFALATGSGAVAGAVLAGPVGAVVGAGIGAGVSTVVWLREDQHASLPANTGIVFSLLEPLTFATPDEARNTPQAVAPQP